MLGLLFIYPEPNEADMATNRTGCSRLYLKKSHARSMRKYNKYRKAPVVPKAAAVEKADNAASPEAAEE